MHSHGMKSARRAVGIALLAALCWGHDAPAQQKLTYADAPSRWDIFAGYSYLAPKATVQVIQPNGAVLPVQYTNAKSGLIFSSAYFYNRYVGVQLEEAVHDLWVDSAASNDGFLTMTGGVVVRAPAGHLSPFVHALAGAALIGGPQHEPYKWGPDLTIGGGVDLNTSMFNGHLGIRLFQADYEYMHHNWGQVVYGGNADINAWRLSTGLVLHMGSLALPPSLTMECTATPASVYAGDPVSVTAAVGNADPRGNPVITISGEGISGTGSTVIVNTSSLSPGVHTVVCEARQAKPARACSIAGTATFTVKEFDPPTIACSANPATIKPGENSTITITAVSPQNRPLTYTFTASAGAVQGSGASATFSSTGAPTGPTTITSTVTDDKGHSASCTTTVSIEAPIAQALPATKKLCSIDFSADKMRPTRVDNEAKACLDEIALNLVQDPNAEVVLVGQSDATEKKEMEKAQPPAAHQRHPNANDPAAQRAVNAKQYLVTEKGIDSSRIKVASSPRDGHQVENYLVPAGANFNTEVPGTSKVDESAVAPQVRKPLGARHPRKPARPKSRTQ